MCQSALHQVHGVLADGTVLATDVNGVRRRVVLLALEGAPPLIGEWLVVHSGYAVGRVSADEARSALAELSTADRGRVRGEGPAR